MLLLSSDVIYYCIYNLCLEKNNLSFLNKLWRISNSDNQFSEGCDITQNMMAQMRKISETQKNVIPGIMKCIDSKTRPQFC